MLRLVLAGALMLAGTMARADEERFVVYASICDADNEVHCQLKAGIVRVFAWLTENPAFHLGSVNRCARADEHEL